MITLHVAINSWLARLSSCHWRYELKGAPSFPRKASAAWLWNNPTNPFASRDTLCTRHAETTSVLWRVVKQLQCDVGLAFRGHDKSQESNNQGNFLELLTFLANHNEEVRAVALKNAPENLKLTSPKIQDIVKACAMETINVIIRDMGDIVFSILVDESRDVSIKEQMVVMFRYVDKRGCVIERFIGIEHVPNTTAISLKIAINKLFSKHGMSISKLRGQGYDGASNMSGEFNGLKSTFLTVVSNVVNVVGASSKRRDILREKLALKVIKALKGGELMSGRGQNQESRIKRPCDTRWGSHFGTLVSFTIMFSSIIDVLEEITNDRLNSDKKFEASIM
ncbi:uncharacterized protein LOC133814118 [Humulus lupulus]|uniref:uncharacterized protein LOC133814118 n=1 Tax=Humulus lupulus TaxID=3486 RepID=UPI002B412BD3|nr:uncharacterized protein LOC133814118 [Humulus lupulus]